jgi:hypothetical protein
MVTAVVGILTNDNFNVAFLSSLYRQWLLETQNCHAMTVKGWVKGRHGLYNGYDYFPFLPIHTCHCVAILFLFYCRCMIGS